MSSPAHYQRNRVSPTSSAEKALVSETLIAYHEDGLFEVWFHYPAGFISGRVPGHPKDVYLTDPNEAAPGGFVPDGVMRYYARTDREAACMDKTNIRTFFRYLYQVDPVGILVIPGYVAPDAPLIPATCPDAKTLPSNWALMV